jgi:hypothetical protein
VTHLTGDELRTWRDTPSEDARQRIVSHLAACDECAATYAELFRTREAGESASRFSPADFAARGYGTVAASRPGRVLAFRPRVLLPLAAAAAVVFMLFLPGLQPGSDRVVDTDAVRGGRLQGLAPAGPASDPIEFRWASPVAASRYVVEVRDDSGTVVLQRETRDDRLRLDPASAEPLRPGASYSWTVRALDSDGEAVGVSSPRTFSRAGSER